MSEPKNRHLSVLPETEMSAEEIVFQQQQTNSNPRRRKVVGKIRDLMTDRGLSIGDRLPGERQMALEFGVSRGTIREAIQFLAIMGFLKIRHGGGSYLLAMPDELGQSQNGWTVWIRQNQNRVLEVLEVRTGVEALSAELAARRARPDDYERMTKALRAMKASEKSSDITAFVQSDLEFHEALVESTGNKTLQELLKTLGEELVPERAAVTGLEDRMSVSYAEHLEIYKAVASGDEILASKAMRRHLASIKQDILSKILHEDEASNPAPADEDTTEPGSV